MFIPKVTVTICENVGAPICDNVELLVIGVVELVIAVEVIKYLLVPLASKVKVVLHYNYTMRFNQILFNRMKSRAGRRHAGCPRVARARW